MTTLNALTWNETPVIETPVEAIEPIQSIEAEQVDTPAIETPVETSKLSNEDQFETNAVYFDKGQLLAFCSYASRDNTRYALANLCFERKDNQLYLVATDGKCLGKLELGESIGNDVQKLVSIGDIKDLEKIAKRNECIAIDFLSEDSCIEWKISKPNKHGEHVYNRFSGELELQDGRFPDWRKVFPTESTSFDVTIDPQLIADCCKAATKFNQLDNKGLVFHFVDSVKAVVAKTKRLDRNLEIVMMPLTVNR